MFNTKRCSLATEPEYVGYTKFIYTNVCVCVCVYVCVGCVCVRVCMYLCT